MKCRYDVSWRGACNDPTRLNSQFCEKHEGVACTVCGKQAVKECEESAGLGCSNPLCQNCICSCRSIPPPAVEKRVSNTRRIRIQKKSDKVHCRDCMWWVDEECHRQSPGDQNSYGYGVWPMTKGDWFCGDGEKA